MFFESGYLYYICILLQAICVIHCLRKGYQQKWIWIIVFLPYVGALAYFFSEIVNGNQVKQVGNTFGAIINPSGSIKKLRAQVEFSDTFQNRMALADAYLATGQVNNAIELYESCCKGVFVENEYLLGQMIVAYSMVGRYDHILPLARKIYNAPQFSRSRAHMLYALALEKTGDSQTAESEFQKMQARFSYYEQRYNYGLFLIRAGRDNDARQLFTTINKEAQQLSSREKRDNRIWFARAKEAIQKMDQVEKV
ncbi:PLDc N-terminal domain-containing protein [Danxiaibacter flavus]|uniref:PLDc N-terminal domain-containing protein n=1 Tax=Danxiaibacter flavus TaxID=3049108 RepID=A0ABV3Z871_9BACT|nr:PLDc N-terminal domain-containing protein [Chitinophagaceae bacterium DXS]